MRQSTNANILTYYLYPFIQILQNFNKKTLKPKAKKLCVQRYSRILDIPGHGQTNFEVMVDFGFSFY